MKNQVHSSNKYNILSCNDDIKLVENDGYGTVGDLGDNKRYKTRVTHNSKANLAMVEASLACK